MRLVRPGQHAGAGGYETAIRGGNRDAAGPAQTGRGRGVRGSDRSRARLCLYRSRRPSGISITAANRGFIAAGASALAGRTNRITGSAAGDAAQRSHSAGGSSGQLDAEIASGAEFSRGIRTGSAPCRYS